MDDGKSDADTSVDSTLDTKTYPEDFVSRMFNSIDWEARKKTPRSRGDINVCYLVRGGPSSFWFFSRKNV